MLFKFPNSLFPLWSLSLSQVQCFMFFFYLCVFKNGPTGIRYLISAISYVIEIMREIKPQCSLRLQRKYTEIFLSCSLGNSRGLTKNQDTLNTPVCWCGELVTSQPPNIKMLQS